MTVSNEDEVTGSKHGTSSSANTTFLTSSGRGYISPVRGNWLLKRKWQSTSISSVDAFGSIGSFDSGITLSQSQCLLHRATTHTDLDLLLDPQGAPPPELKVIDPARERESFRRQLQRYPETITAMPCLPRFVSGAEIEYVTTRRDEIGIPMLAGIGQYGCVYVARHVPSGQILTVKLLSNESTSIYDLALEASIAQHLEVTTVVPNFWGVAVVEQDDRYLHYCLIQEYVGSVRTLEGYDVNILVTINRLGQYFHRCTPLFDSVDWTALCCRIVSALNTIHKMGVVINDLKGDNILIKFQGATNHIFFIDFGMARYRTDLSVNYGLTTDREREEFLSRFFLTAPEIVFTGWCYKASDIYSLGWLLGSISVTCDLPQMRGIVDWCLRPLPSQRPTAKQLVQATKDIFYDAIARKMLLCQHQYLRSQLWKLYAQSPDHFSV